LAGLITVPVRPKLPEALHKFSLMISSVGTILSYVFYWIAVIVTLIFLKFKEVSHFLRNLCTFSLSLLSRVVLRFLVANRLQRRGGSRAELKGLMTPKRRQRRVELVSSPGKKYREPLWAFCATCIVRIRSVRCSSRTLCNVKSNLDVIVIL
jgi:hypothetical protein